MASRRFYYLIPGRRAGLDFSVLLEGLMGMGFVPDPEVAISQVDDADEPLTLDLRAFERISLGEIAKLPSKRTSVFLDLSGSRLYLTCRLGSPQEPPFAVLMLPRRMWFELDGRERSKTEEDIARCAASAGAQSVLVLDDPADEFLGRVEAIEDRWLFELETSQGRRYEDVEVWAGSAHDAPELLRSTIETGRSIGPYLVFRLEDSA